MPEIINVLALLTLGYALGRVVRIGVGLSAPLWVLALAAAGVVATSYVLRGTAVGAPLLFVGWGALPAFERKLSPEGAWWHLWRWKLSL